MPEPFLRDLRVVALEQAVAAPLCSRRLAQAGADVVKIERPEGDFARFYDTAVRGESAYFVWLNYGKRSIVLDFRTTEGLTNLKALIGSADVFIQNLKPGALARAGVDLQALREANPRLITCTVAGYGSTGPSANKKAYDLLIQAETGLSAITGSPHAPGRVGVSVCDIATGMFAYEAILGALLQRAATERGEAIEVTLFDAMAEWMAVPYLLERYGGTAPQRVGLAHPGIAPYGVFRSADDVAFVLAIQNEREWKSLCEGVLKDADFATAPRSSSNQLRVTNRDFVDGTVQTAVGKLVYEPLSALLTTADIAHAPVNEVGALKGHPDFATDPVLVNGAKVELPRTPGHASGPATPSVPTLGEHTAAVLRELAELLA